MKTIYHFLCLGIGYLLSFPMTLFIIAFEVATDTVNEIKDIAEQMTFEYEQHKSESKKG